MVFDLYVNSKNALLGLESALRIAISNANNFNTPGYKYVFASFTTLYNDAISVGTKETNPIQMGAGVTLGSTSTDYKQGNITIGTALDVAIVGEGLFMLSQSASDYTSGAAKVYSRAGRFQTDSANQYLVDTFGRKVYGYKLDASGNRVSNDLVPIQTDGNTDIGFIEEGILVKNYNQSKEDNTVRQEPLYQLALTTFENKQGLILVSGSAYKSTAASGEQLDPNTAGNVISKNGSSYGDILPESLESSNVDVARVALDMNLLNRQYAATQALIDDVTKILQNLISKLQ